MKVSAIGPTLCAVAMFLSALVTPPIVKGEPPERKARQFICVLRLANRFYSDDAWTREDKAVVERHFERLKSAAESGIVILAGRTEEPNDKTFGIVVFEAPDSAAARAFMENDPAVKAGIMTAELHPYIVAVQRPAQGVTTR